MPMVSFRLFAQSASTPAADSIERYVSENTVLEMLQIYRATVDVKGCVMRLLRVLKSNTGVTGQTIFEMLFAELFRLPNPAAPDMWYFCVSIELIRADPSLSEMLENTMQLLFSNLGNMDIECIDRYALWTAHFINYFQFKFCWAHWFSATDNMDGSQAVFVREVFSRLLRLSFYQKLKEHIPAELSSLLPKQAQPAFNKNPFPEEVRDELPISTILKTITTKDKTAADVLAIIDAISVQLKAPAENDEDFDPDEYDPEDQMRKLRLDVFLECAFRIASSPHITSIIL